MRAILPIILISLLCYSCSTPEKKEEKKADPITESLIFHASFDKTTAADFSKGDGNLYDAPSRKSIVDSSSTELNYAAVALVKNSGINGGGALKFNDKTKALVYFKSKDNVNFEEGNWQGTISFWLKLNPNEDLKPGFCDPIQITDVSYNDASVWVDFTKDSVRQFRLGVIGDLTHWNPDTLGNDVNPAYEKRLARVENPPFSRDSWTHVTITHSQLGSDTGSATLYLNGNKAGSIESLSDPFNWKLEKSNIFLGLNYIGLFDELKIFARPFTASEVSQLHERTLKK